MTFTLNMAGGQQEKKKPVGLLLVGATTPPVPALSKSLFNPLLFAIFSDELADTIALREWVVERCC